MPLQRIRLTKGVWNKIMGKSTRPSPEGKVAAKLLEGTKKSYPQEGGVVFWDPSKDLANGLLALLIREVRYSKNINSQLNLDILSTIERLKTHLNEEKV